MYVYMYACVCVCVQCVCVCIPRDPGLIHLIVNGELVAHVTAKHVQRVRARLRIHATPLLLEILLVEVRTLQEPLPRSLALSRIVDVSHADTNSQKSLVLVQVL